MENEEQIYYVLRETQNTVMAYSSTAQHERNAVNRMVSVVDLLENPDLARIYAYLTRSMDERTTEEVIENLDLAQTTAYENLDYLVESGLVIELTRLVPTDIKQIRSICV
jgi:predicted transcriptional regulator